VRLFRWANEREVNGMPTPESLEAEGWVRVRQHPFWPLSILMCRRNEDDETQVTRRDG